jgi:hypothetical protein
MLALKLGLSLPSSNSVGGWQPTDEASLEAWYQFNEGILLEEGNQVRTWQDSSGNGLDMVQATESERPTFSAGTLTFDSSVTSNLQTSGQISMAGDFTIGIRCYPTSFNNVIIADNTTSNEFFKFTTTSQLRVKIDGSTQNITLDAGTFGDNWLVVTRTSNVLRLYLNGAQQSTTPTLSGTTDIDAIGVRATDTNAYDGTIKEIQIFSSSTSRLVANVNDRLSTL